MFGNIRTIFWCRIFEDLGTHLCNPQTLIGSVMLEVICLEAYLQTTLIVSSILQNNTQDNRMASSSSQTDSHVKKEHGQGRHCPDTQPGHADFLRLEVGVWHVMFLHPIRSFRPKLTIEGRSLVRCLCPSPVNRGEESRKYHDGLDSTPPLIGYNQSPVVVATAFLCPVPSSIWS
jgi:hypothetical protein